MTIIRFKRVDSCINNGKGLQMSELAVMGKAAKGCANGGMCVGDITETMHISKPAVSQILNNLERRELITRAIDKKDRRKITVNLTPAGRAALHEAMTCLNEMMDDVLNSFGSENTKTLVALLNELMDIFENYDK